MTVPGAWHIRSTGPEPRLDRAGALPPDGGGQADSLLPVYMGTVFSLVDQAVDFVLSEIALSQANWSNTVGPIRTSGVHGSLQAAPADTLDGPQAIRPLSMNSSPVPHSSGASMTSLRTDSHTLERSATRSGRSRGGRRGEAPGRRTRVDGGECDGSRRSGGRRLPERQCDRPQRRRDHFGTCGTRAGGCPGAVGHGQRHRGGHLGRRSCVQGVRRLRPSAPAP